MPACSEGWNERISAVLDGEAGGDERALVARHLPACAGCRGVWEGYRALSRQLAMARGPEDVAPAREALAPVAATAARRSRLPRRWAVAVTGLAAAAALLLSFRPVGLNSALAEEVEAHHLRSFALASPCEFQSPDPLAVRTWIEQKVGYPVHVPQVRSATLLGARRCRLRGVLTASLLYRRDDGRALTLFVTAPGSPADGAVRRFAADGPRCTGARLGEQICAAQVAAGGALVIADAAPAELSALVASL